MLGVMVGTTHDYAKGEANLIQLAGDLLAGKGVEEGVLGEVGRRIATDLMVSGAVSLSMSEYGMLARRANEMWKIEYEKLPNYLMAEGKSLTFQNLPSNVKTAYQSLENPTKTGVKLAVGYVARNTPIVAEKVTEYSALALGASTAYISRYLRKESKITVEIKDHHRQLDFYDPPAVLKWYNGRHFLYYVPRFDFKTAQNLKYPRNY